MEVVNQMSTYVAKPADIKRKWYVIDADGLTLGRLASEVEALLAGIEDAATP